MIVGAVIGATIGGIIAYNAAKDNDSEGWELFGWTALGILGGGVVGGAIGYGIGYYWPLISSFLGSSFSFTIPTFGTVNAGGALALGGGITITVSGAQIVTGATVALGAGILMFARTPKRDGYYGERWPGDPHKPDHVHLRGNKTDIRIGRDGNPLPGEKALDSQARKALEKLWDEFLKLFNKW